MQRVEITARYLEALELERADPGRAFLGEISSRHVARFPFSSVGARLGHDLPLDLDSLFQRLVVRGRGGYCFEHNGLLFEVLRELGFDVELFLARVIFNQEVHPGLTHRVTIASVEGQRYLVDAGFGFLGPRSPVPLSSSEESREPLRVFRVARPEAGPYRREIHLQTLDKGEYFSLYRFDDGARYGQEDCELGHFFSHRHPRATFVNHLVVSRILADEIRSLRDRSYHVLREDRSEQRALASPVELRALLDDAFGIEVTAEESRVLFAEPPAAASGGGD